MRIASHRGIGTGHPHNTLAAMQAAIAEGASILEIDLRTTLDGQIVLIHNKIHPQIRQPRLVVNETNYKELVAAAQQVGARIERFCDVYPALPQVDLILDIKWRSGEDTLHALDAWSRSQGCRDALLSRTSFLVWLPEHAKLVSRLFPEARLVANRMQCVQLMTRALTARTNARAQGLTWVSIPGAIFRSPRLAARMVNNLREEGVALINYLPTTPLEVRESAALGVDVLMTDRAPLWSSVASAGRHRGAG